MRRLNRKRKPRTSNLLTLPPYVVISKPLFGKLSLAASISAMLLLTAGCQSMPTATNQQSRPTIDFSRADSATMSAQSRAFQEALPANTAEYQALFAQSGAVNSEQQAKLQLLAAMSQHLTSPHWSSSQVRYHGAPFVDKGSIDQGADSIFKTLFDVYLYQARQSLSSEDGDTTDDAEQVVNEIAEAPAQLGETDEAAADYPLEDDYGDDYESVGDNDVDDNHNIFGMTNLNPFQILQDYAEMRNQETVEDSANSMGVLPNFLSLLQRTPEQIAAKNEYQNQYLTVNTLSRFDPQQKQIQSILSYDYLAPTLSSSIQLPIAMDFAHNRLRVDPAAMMPLVALTRPDETMLPNDLAGKTIDFHLTDKMRANVPTGVIYDAVIQAFLASLGEIEASSFTPIDISEDDFAKDIRAARAIKIDFDAKQSGATLGRMFKHLTKSLNDYVKANPQNTDENLALQEILAKIQFYNQGYQSADVGSLFQLIEAIAPVDFNNSNYYYLDASNRLIGKQQRVDVASGLIEARNQIVSQSRYESDLSRHPLAAKLSQTFNASSSGIDGNAWLSTIRQNEYRSQQAAQIRQDYGLDEESLEEDVLIDGYSSNIVIDDVSDAHN